MQKEQKSKVDALEQATEQLARLFVLYADELNSIKNIKEHKHGTEKREK